MLNFDWSRAILVIADWSLREELLRKGSEQIGIKILILGNFSYLL